MFKNNILFIISSICIIVLSTCLVSLIYETIYFLSCQHTIEVLVDGERVYLGPAYKVRSTDRTVKIYSDNLRYNRQAEYTNPNLVIKTVEEK